MSDTRPPLDVEALARALGPVLFAHTPFRPDAQEGDYGGMVNIAMHNDTLARERIACQRAAEKVAAAYQSTGPDDLAGLTEAAFDAMNVLSRAEAGAYLGTDLLGYEASRVLARLRAFFPNGYTRGVTLTGARSSEVDGLREAVARLYQRASDQRSGIPSKVWESILECRAALTGARSSEVDELLRDVERVALAIHTSNDHPSVPGCLDMDRDSAELLINNLTGDTGPKVEPEPLG